MRGGDQVSLPRCSNFLTRKVTRDGIAFTALVGVIATMSGGIVPVLGTCAAGLAIWAGARAAFRAVGSVDSPTMARVSNVVQGFQEVSISNVPEKLKNVEREVYLELEVDNTMSIYEVYKKFAELIGLPFPAVTPDEYTGLIRKKVLWEHFQKNGNLLMKKGCEPVRLGDALASIHQNDLPYFTMFCKTVR